MMTDGRPRLARYGGVGPIGSSTGRVDVAGRSWDLYVGNNGNMKVFSFVAPSPVNSFSADVKLFFNHIQSRQNFPMTRQNLLGKFTK
jgi:xyloglucan-specific endo-beta-1,4-glucanase